MLEKGNLPINLNAPMDTKVDDKLTNQEIFILHQNARFRKIGSIIKRNGYKKVNIPSADITTYNLNTRRVLTEDNNVLLFPEAGALAASAYRSANDSFSFTNVRTPCEMNGRIVAAEQDGGVVAIDSDFMDGFRAIIYCRLTSSATNNVLILDLTDESTGAKRTVVVDNTTRRNGVVRFFRNTQNEPRICVAYDDSTAANTGRARVFNLNLTQINDRSFTVTETTRTFAAEAYGNNVVVSVKSSANVIRFCIVPETAALTQYTFTTLVNVRTLATSDIRISGTTCYCMYITDSTTAAARFFSINLTNGATVNTDRQLHDPSNNLTNCTFDLISSNVIGFFTSVGVSSVNFPILYYGTHTISTSTTGTINSKEGYTGITRCRLLNLNPATANTLVIATTDSAMRNLLTLTNPTNIGTMYLVAIDNAGNGFNIISSYNSETVPITQVDTLQVNSNMYYTSAGVLSCASLRTTALFTGANTVELASAYIANFNFSSAFYQKNYTTKFSKNMYISSGYLMEYDGLALSNSGFFHSPALVSPATISGSGSSIAAGTYNFRIVFEYIDSKGQRYQSAPSNAFQVVVGAPTGNISLGYVIPVSYRAGSAVTVYMTQAGGSVFYRITSYPIPLTLQVLSSPTGAEEVLYTTGGVLPNDPAPPLSFICTHQERLFGIVADFENEIAYTKRSALGAGAEFSDFQRIFLAASGVKSRNELTGLASMNEKLIIFRRSSLYYILGDGPNILGEQNNFTEPELIANDIGCIQPKSIVSSPKGVFFKSEKGIYLLDPSLNVSYIGSPVEQYNNEEIIGHLIDEEENLVQFLTTNRIIAYDYVLERWNIDAIQALDIGVFNKKNVLVQNNNSFIIEDNSYKDFNAGNETGITLLVETGWIKASGIQDFGRFVNALILGKYKSSHTLRVDVYYDYNDAVATTYDLVHDPLQSVYQFRVHLKQQKAEAIKFRIFDIPSNFGESCELTNLTLQLGIKKGTYKTPKTRNY